MCIMGSQKVPNHIKVTIAAGQMERCQSTMFCGLQIPIMGSQKILNNIKMTKPAGPMEKCPSIGILIVDIRAILQHLLDPRQIPNADSIQQLSIHIIHSCRSLYFNSSNQTHS